MPTALVTGGTGGLGSELVPRLKAAGYAVRISSRKTRPEDTPTDIDWATMDIESGEGIDAALAGVDVVAHCASSPFRKTKKVDVLGTRTLLERARAASLQHFFYISIVGIDKIPNPYYKVKLAAEKVIVESGVPYSILRATQFHTLIDRGLKTLARGPVALLPTDFKFQTIDTSEVAQRMADYIPSGPSGMLPDLGGPAVMTLAEMYKDWLAARDKKKRVLRLPMFGKIATGFREGYNCCPDHADGKITWQEYLATTYGETSAEG